MSGPPYGVILSRTARSPSSRGEPLVVALRTERPVVHAPGFVFTETVVLVADYFRGLSAEGVVSVTGSSGIV